eukprot:TRINITY_DN2447_c0_g1_i1.p1 TRINITY_DN2447_c0_g1~~TRINITY_DN2447_c0_g1_i1.p1  ORF type:complete len:730 (+),score=115.38 TRINITY_DN2447_c0_g1_i1:622-2811(+)
MATVNTTALAKEPQVSTVTSATGEEMMVAVMSVETAKANGGVLSLAVAPAPANSSNGAARAFVPKIAIPLSAMEALGLGGAPIALVAASMSESNMEKFMQAATAQQSLAEETGGAPQKPAPVLASPPLSLSLFDENGKPLPVQFLPEPLHFTIAPNATDEMACVFWNETLNTWDNSGVTKVEHDGPDLICATTHLSIFAAVTGFFAEVGRAIECSNGVFLFSQASADNISNTHWARSGPAGLFWALIFISIALVLIVAYFDYQEANRAQTAPRPFEFKEEKALRIYGWGCLVVLTVVGAMCLIIFALGGSGDSAPVIAAAGGAGLLGSLLALFLLKVCGKQARRSKVDVISSHGPSKPHLSLQVRAAEICEQRSELRAPAANCIPSTPKQAWPASDAEATDRTSTPSGEPTSPQRRSQAAADDEEDDEMSVILKVCSTFKQLPEKFIQWVIRRVQSSQLGVTPDSVEYIVKAQNHDVADSHLAWVQYKATVVAKDRDLADCSDRMVEEFLAMSGWANQCTHLVTALHPVYRVLCTSVCISRTARIMIVCLKMFAASACSALWFSSDSIMSTLPRELQEQCSKPRSVIIDIVIGFVSTILSDGVLILLLKIHGKPPVLDRLTKKHVLGHVHLKTAQIAARVRLLAFWAILIGYISVCLYMIMAFLAGVSEKDGWAWFLATGWILLEYAVLAPIKAAVFIVVAVAVVMACKPAARIGVSRGMTFGSIAGLT